jgi:hypothetical protein
MMRRTRMMRWVRSRLSFASVTSLLAIFVALGGTGYAAITLPDNSVSAKQIKRNGVGAAEIRKNAVRSGEVRNGTLGIADFRAGTIPPGPQGPQGLQGVQGLQGEPGSFEDVTVQFTEATADLADGTSASYNAFCPAGQVGIGGGFRGDFEDSEATNVGSSRPSMSPGNTEPPLDGGTFTGWRITVLNPTGGVMAGIRPQVWVFCGTP